MSGTTDILLTQHTKVKLGQEVLKLLFILEICRNSVFKAEDFLVTNWHLTSLGWLAMAMVPSVLYLIGAPPSCTSVP